MVEVKLIFVLSVYITVLIEIVYVKELAEEAGNYCNMEMFQAECRSNEVIVMKHAVYGRMKIGKCISVREFTLISKDETTLGCSSDVLNIMDQKCSGKTKCEIRIPDNDLETTKPCNEGLKMYLQSSYQCVTVIEQDDRTTCSVVAAATVQYIKMAKSQKCGSAAIPWTIETSLGKTIQLSMYDFRSLKPVKSTSKTPYLTHATCLKMGSITDKSTKKQEAICDNNTRHKLLFSSNGNVVEITLNDMSVESNQIFLGIKATGCSDIIPTEDSWMKRDGNSLTVGCYSSRKTWTLTCQHDKWIGTIGNCSHETAWDNTEDNVKAVDNEEKINMTSEHQILVIMAIAGFGLVVCLTIVCIGVICVNKCYNKKSSFDPRMHDGASCTNGVGYYNTNLGENCPRENETIVTRQFKDRINNEEHYEESKYFVLDQETSNERKPLA